MFERGCLMLWMLLMTTNTIILGLAIELLVFGVILSLNHIILINQSNAPLLLMGVFAVPALLIIARLRQYGIENLNFEIHEAALNKMMEPPESWSNLILALLDETSLRSQELVTLVRLIDEAPGAVERRDRRAETRAWLELNRHKLTEEDQAFINEHLGYMR